MSAADALGEAHGGRFVLGLGVSHAPLVTVRGHDYTAPLRVMREYLDAMDSVRYAPPPPEAPVPRVLAALRRGMLELARDRTAGAHPYFVPVAHTERARSILGPGQPAGARRSWSSWRPDPVRARAIARETTSGYLTLPNYTNNLRELGYGDDDLADGAATGWWTTSSRGETSTLFRSGWRPICGRERIVSPCSRSRAISTRRWSSPGRWRRPS